MDDATTSMNPSPRADNPQALDDGATTAADTSLTSVMHDFDAVGHDGQFAARDGALLLCLTCHEEFPAAGQRADDVRRLEGASDPADMVMVVPVRCPHCGTAGTLTAHYGPEASAEEADVLVALDRQLDR
jgi:hypothetical protein